jgi:hypothetical protein
MLQVVKKMTTYIQQHVHYFLPLQLFYLKHFICFIVFLFLML